MKAVVIRHVLFEDLGTFATPLRDHGYDIRYLDAGVEPLDKDLLYDASLLIILGGPIGVSDADSYPFLSEEMEAIARRIEDGRPVLGICLGAQLIAKALGADVAATGKVEIGYSALTLTAAGESSPLKALDGVPVLHWHGDQFEIPDGAELLASTPGFPNQAFRIGHRILAVQFHPEVDHRRIEQWLIGHSGELSGHGLSPDPIRRDAQTYGPDLEHRSAEVLSLWLQGIA